MSEYDPNYVFKPNYFLVGVKTVITGPDDKILVLQRSGKSSNPHQFDFSGGGVDKGENPIESAIREIKEETGLEVNHLKPITTCFVNERGEDAIIIVFSARTKDSQVILSWEHESYEWLTLDEIKKMNLPKLHNSIFNAYESQKF